MIKWYDNLYMDDVVQRKQKKIIQAINKEKPLFGTYCIAFASNKSNLFDIINVNELLFKHYKRNDIYIIGLAFGRDSAIEVMINMIQEIYQVSGEFDVRKYFKFN